MKAGQQPQLALSLFTDTNNSKPDESTTGTANRKGSVRNRRGHERDPLLDHPAVQLYREIVRLSLNNVQRQQVANAVGDSPASLALYREVLVQFMSEGQPRQRADWTVERFQKAEQLTTERFSVADESQFSAEAILEHLERCRRVLCEVGRARMDQHGPEDALVVAMSDAAFEVFETIKLTCTAQSIAVREIDERLTTIEKSLVDAMVAVAPATEYDAAEATAHERLKEYRSQMELAAYAESFQRLVAKTLRERFGVPRLSLYA